MSYFGIMKKHHVDPSKFQKNFELKENKILGIEWYIIAIFIVTLVAEYSFLSSAKSESSSWIWNGTNTIPDFTNKELPISSLFPTDKFVIDASSEYKETPSRFNHYSNSKASFFPLARSPNRPENYETTILNPSIPSSFPPPNGQTALFIPSHFPPVRSPRQFRRL